MIDILAVVGDNRGTLSETTGMRYLINYYGDTIMNNPSIISEMNANGSTRDEIIIALVTQDGRSLNSATNAYAQFAKTNGLTKAIVSHKEDALEHLYGNYPMSHWDVQAVKDAVVELVAMFNVQESTARDYCKAYSKIHNIAHPTLNPRTAIFEWFKEHDGTTDKKAFLDFAVNGLGRSQSNANEYWKGYELHLYLTK